MELQRAKALAKSLNIMLAHRTAAHNAIIDEQLHTIKKVFMKSNPILEQLKKSATLRQKKELGQIIEHYVEDTFIQYKIAKGNRRTTPSVDDLIGLIMDLSKNRLTETEIKTKILNRYGG